MIDTDKYENHDMIRIAKQLLIEDAPLLLEEVKRLRKELEDCWEYISHIDNHDMQSLADDSYSREKDRLRRKLNERSDL
tara:strand:- start:1893 stop:2129 length:237 start_codon:yes stop_codon:yes gene_type:complete